MLQDEIKNTKNDQENFLDPKKLQSDKNEMSRIVIMNRVGIANGGGDRIWKPKKVEFSKPALNFLKQRVGNAIGSK